MFNLDTATKCYFAKHRNYSKKLFEQCQETLYKDPMYYTLIMVIAIIYGGNTV